MNHGIKDWFTGTRTEAQYWKNEIQKDTSDARLKKLYKQIEKEERGESRLHEIIRVIKRIIKGDIWDKESEFVRLYDAERDAIYMDKRYRPEELAIYEIEMKDKDWQYICRPKKRGKIMMKTNILNINMTTFEYPFKTIRTSAIINSFEYPTSTIIRHKPNLHKLTKPNTMWFCMLLKIVTLSLNRT